MASALSFGDSIPFANVFGGGGTKTGTASQLTGAFSSAGGAVDSFFGSKASAATAAGARAAAAGLRAAAGIAQNNLGIEEQSIGIKQLSASRSIFQTDSSMRANIAGNGFAEAGSAMDLLKDSATQGDLQHSLVSQQGEIDLNSIKTQVLSLNTQADQQDAAAAAASNGSMISGVIKGVTAAAQLAMFFA